MGKLGVLFLWIAGMTGYAGMVLMRHRHLVRRLRAEPPVRNHSLLALLHHCQARTSLRRPIRLVELDGLPSPAVFGLWKPVLLLPTGLAERLSQEGLRGVLLHELIHVKRGDPLINWLIIGLQAIHWWNPLVWLAFKNLRADRELSRDGEILKKMSGEERHSYGAALIQVAAECSAAPVGPVLVPVIAPKSELKRRIVMIADPRLHWVTASPLTFLPVIFMVGLTFTAATDPAVREESKAPVEKTSGPTASASSTVWVPEYPTIRRLEQESVILRDRIRVKQDELDELQDQVQVSPNDAISGTAPLEREGIRELEAVFRHAKSKHEQLNSLWGQLKELDRASLRQVLPTAVHDPLFERLILEQAKIEQSLSVKQNQYSTSHPDIQSLNQSLRHLNTEIEERMDGILVGMNARLASSQAGLEALRSEMEKATSREMERQKKLRPLLALQRDLANLRTSLERFEIRLQQAGMETAFPASKQGPNLQHKNQSIHER